MRYTPNRNYNGPDSFEYRISDGQGGTDTATVDMTVEPVNDAPQATDDSYQTEEDTTLNVPARGVLENDSDVDDENGSLTAQIADGPQNGTVTLNDDGSFDYTPNENFNGEDSFTYTVSDGQAQSEPATVTITVTPVNDAPTVRDDQAETREDTPVDIDVLQNDSDAENNLDPSSVEIVDPPANGSTSVDPDTGRVTYSPNADYNGTDTFTYRVCDGADPRACSEPATVAVDVTPVNDPPQTQPDSEKVLEDNSVTFPTTDLTQNDTPGPQNESGQNLTVTEVGNARNGTVSLQNGEVTFTPNRNYNGPASFEYTVCDDGDPQQCSTETVDVEVRPVNDAPIAQNDSATTDEDTPAVIDVKANDSAGPPNEDGQNLTVEEIATQPSNGTAEIITDGPDAGKVRYTPKGDYNGPDSFEYRVCDTANPGKCDTATVNVRVNAVNDDPTVSNIEDQNINEDGSTGPLPFTVGDVETDPNDLRVEASSDNRDLFPTPNNIVIRGTGADRTVEVRPVRNRSGEATITLTVTDADGGQSTETFVVRVAPVNDAPQANDDSYQTDEDTTLTVPARGVLENDSDLDNPNDSLTAQIVDRPQNGTVTLNDDGSFEYTPDANFNGEDSFTYRASDGRAQSEPATVTITVAPTNDAPVARNDQAETQEDTPVDIDVLQNDRDPEGDDLSVESFTQPENGTVTRGANGILTYTPNQNFNGTDTFTYTVTDGASNDTATVTVRVNAVNDSPNARNDRATTNEDTPVRVKVLENDSAGPSNENGQRLSVEEIFRAPANGTARINPDGTVTYTPNRDYNGPDSFDYRISDGQGGTDTATVDVTVTPVNDAPTARNDRAAATEDAPALINVTANDSPGPADEAGQNLTVEEIVGQPANGRAEIVREGPNAGQIRYTPAPNFNGEDTFRYRVCDDGNPAECSTATATVTVAGVNDNPTARDDSYQTREDEALVVGAPGVLRNDSDPEEDNLSAEVTEGPQNGTLKLNGDGSFRYTPNPNFNGRDKFTYTVSDGEGGTDTATANITVTPVNDPPRARNDRRAMTEDRPATFLASSLVSNDSGEPGQNLSVTRVGDARGGKVVLNNGRITFTPNRNYSGPASFAYTVCDDGSPRQCSTARVLFNVRAVNDAPAARNDVARARADKPVRVYVLRNDADPENGIDRSSVRVIKAPANGRARLAGNGVITYIPNAGFSGRDTFRYRVCDTGTPRRCSTATVTVTVAPPRADLAVRVINPKQVRVGNTFGYTVTVTNRGPDTARNVVSRTRIPNSVRFVRAPAGCSYNPRNRTVTCKLGTMPDDASRSRKIVVKAVRPGRASIQGCYVWSNTPDLNRSNNRTGG